MINLQLKFTWHVVSFFSQSFLFFSFSFAILSNYLPTARLLFTPLIGHLCISQTVHTNRKLILMFCGVEVSIPKCEVFDLKTVVYRMYDLKDPREV